MIAWMAFCLQEGVCSQKWTSQLPVFGIFHPKGSQSIYLWLLLQGLCILSSLVLYRKLTYIPYPKFSKCGHSIRGFGSHLELNAHKTDSKYFHTNLETDHDVTTITTPRLVLCSERRESQGARCEAPAPHGQAPPALASAFATTRLTISHTGQKSK